ncbi:DMT family transporter [Fibrella sp. HMF5335]|uniref:DMT family transporter n=1 Tax=Fibrella rubiginis TaxID=2817060 RepID=A0A939GJ19_9BACT|nr:DMT family transporter [Fibrella rubiginis]MBO0937338.1 DMT family transporter [Fibrella rubiginis]
MNQVTLSVLAFVGGVFLALQAGLNTLLGVLLKHSLLASLSAFLSSAVVGTLVVLLSVKNVPTLHQLKAVPHYLWFAGGICSMAGIELYHCTVPKLGIATMLPLGLSGQLLFSVLAGYFGWFDLSVQPINAKKAWGVGALLLDLFLINKS